MTAGPGTNIKDDKCEINCESFGSTTVSPSGRRLAEAPEEADAPGPHTGLAGRELVKTLLEDHPELAARIRDEDGTVATDMLDKLLQFGQLFGQPALA